MADSYTEVASRSWGSRLGGSLKGIFGGLVLIAVAVSLLWWNEGRAVKRARALDEGAGQVVAAAAERVDAANEGKLVHLSGRATTERTLSDTQFGVSQQALKLRRVVEMYQWREHSRSETREKLGGGTETVTTYSYDKGWESRAVNSSQFKHPGGHENPARMPYEPWSTVADTVTLGAFRLSSSLLAEIGGFQRLPSSPEQWRVPQGAQLSGDEIYLGQNPGTPQIGDARIHFEAVYPTDVSVVSVQRGDSFVPYVASNGNTVELLENGFQSAEQMFQAAQDRNTLLTWGLRLLGFVLMFIAFRMLFDTLRVLAAVIPALGSLVGGAIGLVAGILAGVISLIVIAIAWVVYRPLLGVGLLVVAGALLFGLKRAKGQAPDLAVARVAIPPPPPPA